MTERALTVEVYSDVICPWCYVGKRRFERAIQQAGNTVKTHVAWRPFQLNPTMPQNGMDRTAYLTAKFGGPDRFKEMEQRLLDAGRAERIPFAFEKIARTPNTFLAHRLIWYSGIQGRQDAMVDRLFKGYFEEGLDIGTLSILAELADQAGLRANEFLMSEEGAAEVKAEESVGHKMGIRGVPYFVFDGTYGLSGAQPPEVFLSALQRREADRSKDKPPRG
jgi:predicted DsbA family dithiol-disulfide isomerase